MRFLRTIFAIVFAIPYIANAAVRIKAVDVDTRGNHTRLVIESDAAIRFSFFALANPDRMLLDLDDVELNQALLEVAGKVDASHAYLKPIRIGRSESQGVLLEIDSNIGASLESTIASYQPDQSHAYRLVLDIFHQQVKSPRPVMATRQDRMPAHPDVPRDGALAARAGAADARLSGAGTEELLAEVRVNGQAQGDAVMLLRDHRKRILAKAEDLKRWRLNLPKGDPAMHHGAAFHRLDDLPGMTYAVNDANQTLEISAEANSFGATVLAGGEPAHGVPATSAPGGFFNYDLFADASDATRRLSGLFEAGAFSRWGVGVANFLGTNRPLDANRFVRLNSTWTRDFPDRVQSVRFGDVITAASSWGRSVRYGGVQWGTNYGTRPGMVTFPLPSLSGEAALPSTLDYYLDGARLLQRDVPDGPFTIHDLPVVTGQGEARLVMRDILGRENVITQRFYTNPQLLRKGLQSYSYEAGFLRKRFAQESNAYGPFLAAGTHRLGVNDQTTAEIHGELSRDQQTLGLGGMHVLPSFGVVSGSLAASHGTHGYGGLLALGLTRQGKAFGFGANIQMATDDFSQLGLASGGTAPKLVSQAYGSVGTVDYGSFNLSYAAQQWRDRPEIRLASASYNIGIGSFGTIMLSLIRLLAEDKKTILGAHLTIPIDGMTTSSVSMVRQQGKSEAVAQVQRALPAGSGVGYRVVAGAGPSYRQEVGVIVQNRIGAYSFEAGRARGQTGIRGSASGGVAVLGGDAFLARRIDESFGVVEVPGYADVRIYMDNQEVGRTDENGIVLLPRMRAYQKNAIRIDESDLPLDAQIDATGLDAVPYFRSAVKITLPINKSRGALLTVMLDRDTALPPGSVAQIAGSDQTFPTGLRGEIYLTGLQQANLVKIAWHGKRCEFAVMFPESPDPVPDLGVFHCVEKND